MTERALAAAVDAARAAGEIAMKYYRTGFDVMLKPDCSPVTQADREAEAAIVEILTRATPDYGMLGEELGSRGNQETRWIVDPIDGTRNFIRHIPFWATLIGLEDHGEIVAGVIHVPTSGDLYTARRGAGARLNGEPIGVSKTDAIGEAFFLHAGLNLVREAGWWDGVTRLVDATDRQRGFGDFLGYTFVAEGKAEIYAELDLKPWDLAAPKIVVEEAGGRFTDFAGQPTIYTGSALATNGRLHAAALALLRG
jgi:histidinol-phosphatase